MSTFDDMARQAEAAASQARADKEQAAENKKNAAKALVDHGKSVLNEQIMPVLLEAKEAFEKAGVGVSIKEDTSYRDAGRNQYAFITFRCFKADSTTIISGVPYPAGGTAKFEHDGRYFTASFSENRSGASHIKDDGREAATAGAKMAIDSYYAILNDTLARR